MTFIIAGDVQEYTVTGLHPGKIYDVRVLLGSVDVAGPWFSQQMPPVASDVSHLPVPQLQLLCTNATSMLATWKHQSSASEAISSSVLVGFKLLYQKHGDQHQSLLLFAPSQRSYLLLNLE